MIKHLFLDRDGIINEIVMRDGIVSSPRTIDEFHFRKDFIDIVAKLNALSANQYIVSNQPDVARKLMDASVLDEINKEILKHINPKEIVYCTCDNGDDCKCRKPKPGMINDIINARKLLKHECCIVGDSIKDIEAGSAAGIKRIFLETYYNKDQNTLADHKIFSLNELFELNLF